MFFYASIHSHTIRIPFLFWILDLCARRSRHGPRGGCAPHSVLQFFCTRLQGDITLLLVIVLPIVSSSILHVHELSSPPFIFEFISSSIAKTASHAAMHVSPKAKRAVHLRVVPAPMMDFIKVATIKIQAWTKVPV